MKNRELLENYENLDLEKLPEKLRKNGFDYELIKRDNKRCIYAQYLGGKIIAYEIFKTKIINNHENKKQFAKRANKEFDQNCAEYKEIFPNNEEFGKRALSCSTIERANQCYDSFI